MADTPPGSESRAGASPPTPVQVQQTKGASPASAGTGGDPIQQQQGAKEGPVEELKVISGLIAVLGGVIAILVIVCVALGTLKSASAAVTGGITAIGSIVGAYFGVKIGSDGTKDALAGQEKALQQVTKTTEDSAAAKEVSEKARLQDQKDHASALAGLALALHPEEKEKVLATIKEFQAALS